VEEPREEDVCVRVVLNERLVPQTPWLSHPTLATNFAHSCVGWPPHSLLQDVN
jgi:hypothetical protein